MQIFALRPLKSEVNAIFRKIQRIYETIPAIPEFNNMLF